MASPTLEDMLVSYNMTYNMYPKSHVLIMSPHFPPAIYSLLLFSLK